MCACRYQVTRCSAGRVSTMAQRRSTHKGDRAQIMSRPDRVVYDIVKREAAQRGIPMGQYVARMFLYQLMPSSVVSKWRVKAGIC